MGLFSYTKDFIVNTAMPARRTPFSNGPQNWTRRLFEGVSDAFVALASTDSGKGASQVGIEDAAGSFTSTSVEGALAEIGSALAAPAGGDLSGLYPNPTVIGIQGFAIQSAGGPSNGDSLIYNSMTSQWEHAPIVFGGGPPVGPAGGDLGGLYPNPGVVGLQGRPVDSTAPTTNDSLVWDGAQWTHFNPAFALSAIYGSFSDTTDQPLTANTPHVIKYDTTDGSSGVTVEVDPLTLRPTQLKVAYDGVYEFSASLQFANSGGGTATILFWVRVDGVNLANSTSSIEMGNNNNRSLPFVPIVLTLTAGQYVEWVVMSSGSNTSVEHFPAVVGPPAVPAIPSIIASVKRLGA